MFCKDREQPIEKDCPGCVDRLEEYARLASKVAMEANSFHYPERCPYKNCGLCSALRAFSRFGLPVHTSED